jgi:hypothetical protein
MGRLKSNSQMSWKLRSLPGLDRRVLEVAQASLIGDDKSHCVYFGIHIRPEVLVYTAG